MPEGRWHPLPHIDLINQVERSLADRGIQVVNEAFALAKGGNRMFGMMQLSGQSNPEDYSWIAGIRNSHDQSFPVGLAIGSGVFVCDNLAFSGEIVFKRRHTTNVLEDLPALTTTAIAALANGWTSQDVRMEAYKSQQLSRAGAAELIIDLAENDVLNTRQVLPAFKEWDCPRHPEFAAHSNVWRLFNAVTEVIKPPVDKSGLRKGHYLFELPAKTERLHSLCDAACDLMVN
jgi:hypothetical protein